MLPASTSPSFAAARPAWWRGPLAVPWEVQCPSPRRAPSESAASIADIALRRSGLMDVMNAAQQTPPSPAFAPSSLSLSLIRPRDGRWSTVPSRPSRPSRSRHVDIAHLHRAGDHQVGPSRWITRWYDLGGFWTRKVHRRDSDSGVDVKGIHQTPGSTICNYHIGSPAVRVDSEDSGDGHAALRAGERACQPRSMRVLSCPCARASDERDRQPRPGT